VQMGDGMQCRTTLEGFPPDSEWILALNGPGSKPSDGWALSHCGEYWLRVEKGEAIGSIDGKQSELKRMPLNELKSKIRYSRFHTTFKGRVSQGKRFERPFGEQFVFVLEPMPGGWEIVIKEHGRDENLARLTPPFTLSPIQGTSKAGICPKILPSAQRESIVLMLVLPTQESSSFLPRLEKELTRLN